MAFYLQHRIATRSFTVFYPVLLLLSLSAPAQERISGSATGDVADDAAAAGGLVSVEVADHNERSVADAEVMLLTDDLTIAITEGWIGGKEGRIDIELPVAEGRTSPEGLVRVRNLAPMEGATLIVWVDEHFIGKGLSVAEDAGTTIKYTLPD